MTSADAYAVVVLDRKWGTASLLSAHGFASGAIAELVDTGFVAMTTESVLAGQRPIEARITQP
jgi:hypothetical protein